VEETDSELEMEIELRRDMRTLSMGERAPNRSPSRLALEFPLSSHQSGRRTRDPSSDKSRSSSSASQSDNPVPRQGRMIQGTRGDVRDKARGEVPEGELVVHIGSGTRPNHDVTQAAPQAELQPNNASL
jgi:hypothetical protein